jgi:hypothetical protein
VHVLSNMTETEARDFLGGRVGEDLCVTYAVRRDGSIRFAPEPSSPPSAVVPITALTRRRSMAAVGFGLALAACAPHDNPDVEANLRIADPPVTQRRTSPTIPNAPSEPEVLMDGDVGPIEDLRDGDLEAPRLVPGGMVVRPVPPPAGGLSVKALPPRSGN